MSIHFSPEDWARVKEDHRKWWAGELKRPLLAPTVGREPDRPEPALPLKAFTSFYDASVSADEIVDRMDFELSAMRYLGDAFPTTIPNFGPGVVAAFMGCRLENGDSTVWFAPEKEPPIEELTFRFDPEAPWFKRICDIYRACLRKWEGKVLVGMTDIGGNLDILASFRTTQNLLMDLYDTPEEVKRLTWEAHEAWWQYFEAFNAILQPVNPGYSAWVPIYSEVPYYILQCDFAYMISPDMFDEFVKPELAKTCRRLGHAFYHLDGVGQLAHLDSLLNIPELAGIQWVMGDGQPDARHWIDVYRKVRGSGKLLQVSRGHANDGYAIIDFLAEELGDASGIIVTGHVPRAQEAKTREVLQRYGAPRWSEE